MSDRLIRSSKELKKLLDETKIERVKLGKDKKMLSDRRLTLAISRIGNLKDLLIDANIGDEKNVE